MQYVLTLEATDNGVPPLTGETTLTVNVIGGEGLLRFTGLPYSEILEYTVPNGYEAFKVGHSSMLLTVHKISCCFALISHILMFNKY